MPQLGTHTAFDAYFVVCCKEWYEQYATITQLTEIGKVTGNNRLRFQ